MLPDLYLSKLPGEMKPPKMAILGDLSFLNDANFTNCKIVGGSNSNETIYILISADIVAIYIILQRPKPCER